MSEQTENNAANDDSTVDAWAAIFIIAVAVSAAVFWVSGQ